MKSIEERLENWGRYHRDSKGRPATSITYLVCQRMAVEAGSAVREGYREVNPRPEVDESDAKIIDWCWNNAAYRMDKRHHALLPMHFIKSIDQRTTCRTLKIRRYSYESELQQAIQRFGEIVDMLTNADRWYNPVKQSERSAATV